ncbi:MAG: rhodanese-like domain-containing protein [Flavobacteriaceae bacterium]|nr:rhodanese-like domain-containing protein [Flavobacteriaceae bacterium]
MFANQFLSSILPITATALKAKLEQNALIIDTRFIASIFNMGSIPTAIFIGMQGNLERWSYELINDKSSEIYLITEENTDINELYLRFQRAGFTHIKGCLNGGINSWIQENFPIEPYRLIHPTNFIQEIEHINLQNVIDVRTEKEFQNQHIKGSKNIPLDSILNNLAEFNSDNPYYIICQGGYRSIIAASILKRNGIHQTIDIYGGLKNFT